MSPNPLNPAAILRFHTTTPDAASVRIFDLHGRLVRTLIEAPLLAAGIHEVRIDGLDERGRVLATGVYFYRVETGEGVVTGRIAILK